MSNRLPYHPSRVVISLSGKGQRGQMGRLIKKNVAGIRILGFSLAGEETVIAAPEFNVCFDVGRAPREIISVDNICISHGHMDHAAGIAYYLSQRNFVGNAPGRIIIHRSLAQAVQRLMDVWAEIEGHPSSGEICGVEHLEDVQLLRGAKPRRGLIVRPFNVNHAAGALGYTLIEKRHKLKAEFAGKSGPQLVELKKKGVTIEKQIETPLITFTGDTALGRFLDLDFVQNSKVVLVECTFFDPEHRTRAVAGRHIHVDDLPKVFEAIGEGHIVLTHLTRRTDLRTAKSILAKLLSPNDLARTSFLMDRTSLSAGELPSAGASPSAGAGFSAEELRSPQESRPPQELPSA
ncbi:MAG: MBL fold metallo-hydrolase [Planctomycetes bacterium]|nr:MBL fold metallo-hydrolase [Planctomycetota bacterium]